MVEEMPALGKLSRFAAHRERLMIDMLNHLYPDYRYDYKPYRSEAVRIHIDHVEKLILVVGSIS